MANGERQGRRAVAMDHCYSGVLRKDVLISRPIIDSTSPNYHLLHVIDARVHAGRKCLPGRSSPWIAIAVDNERSIYRVRSA